MATIAAQAPKQILPEIVGHVMRCLGDPDLATVTTEEYAIMRSPEGELYNKAVLDKYGMRCLMDCP